MKQFFSDGPHAPQVLIEGATQELLASQAKAVAEAVMRAATAAAEATAAAATKAARQGAAGAGGAAGAPAEAAAAAGGSGSAGAAAAAAGKSRGAEAPPPPAPTVEELVRTAEVKFPSDETPEALKAAVLKEAAQMVHHGKDTRSIACNMRGYAEKTYGSHAWQCTVFANGQGSAAPTYSKTCLRWIMGPWMITLWRVD